MNKLYIFLALSIVGCGPSPGPLSSDIASVEQGVKGDKGDAGLNGTNGINGVDGHVGAVGMQGAVGVRGDTGTHGDAGPQGIAGVGCSVQQNTDGAIITCGHTIAYIQNGHCKKDKD